jgi:hypothetical protein
MVMLVVHHRAPQNSDKVVYILGDYLCGEGNTYINVYL